MNPLNSLFQPDCEKPAQCESPSMLDTLKRRRNELNLRLSDLNAAIEALEGNPQFTTTLELVLKAR